MLIGLQLQAFDFRTTLRNEPFLQLFHCLYVYPITVNLSRKRNLFIRVELRKDDADIRRQPLEVINISKSKSFLLWSYFDFHFCNTVRQCFQGNLEHLSKSGLILRLQLGLKCLATMMRLSSLSLPFGHHCIISCLLSSMLISRQS